MSTHTLGPSFNVSSSMHVEKQIIPANQNTSLVQNWTLVHFPKAVLPVFAILINDTPQPSFSSQKSDSQPWYIPFPGCSATPSLSSVSPASQTSLNSPPSERVCSGVPTSTQVWWKTSLSTLTPPTLSLFFTVGPFAQYFKSLNALLCHLFDSVKFWAIFSELPFH